MSRRRQRAVKANKEKQLKAGYVHHAILPCCATCVYRLQKKLISTVAGRVFVRNDSLRCSLHEEMAVNLTGWCPSQTPSPEYYNKILDYDLYKEQFRIKKSEDGERKV